MTKFYTLTKEQKNILTSIDSIFGPLIDGKKPTEETYKKLTPIYSATNSFMQKVLDAQNSTKGSKSTFDSKYYTAKTCPSPQ